jgi:selenide,water dikinase
VRSILAGGEAICTKAGIPIAGGHTIDSVEPIYGLAAIGLVDPRHLKRNAGARAGDALILGKPLGIGVYSAALKNGKLDSVRYAEMLACATQLNTPGIALGRELGVHALTDVTGFGLLGHLLEICRASDLGAHAAFESLPLLANALAIAREGSVTGASARNWASYGDAIDLSPVIDDAKRALLTDPQTSGGLLVACAPAAVETVLAMFRDEGFAHAAVIGECAAGPARVSVN